MRTRVMILAILTATVPRLNIFPSNRSSLDWPQFRGPGGRGYSEESDPPVRWSAGESIRWKVDLPGHGPSSPIVANGRVFVTSASGYQYNHLHVLCFDAATGRKRWERQFWPTGSTLCNPRTSMAAATPVTDGERVYALFSTGDLACFDRDGNLVWYRALSRDYEIRNNVGMAASPVLWNDTLILPMENPGESFAAGLDKYTGRNRWKVERFRELNYVTPQILKQGSEPEVLFQTLRDVTAYDPRTGQIRWNFEGEFLQIPTPAVAGDLILIPASEMIALRPRRNGSPAEVVWKSNHLRLAQASPLVYRERIYIVTSAGILNCADPSDGKLLWQFRLRGPFFSSPIAAAGRLYVINEEGTTSVIELADKPRVLAENRLNETVRATPAFSRRAIFIRTDASLYCIAR